MRSFGLILGGAFLFVGLWPWIRHGSVRSWAVALAAILAAAALLVPESLTTFHRVWMLIGNGLGWINSKIIFGLLFYLLITPARFILGLAGHDPMNRRFDRNAESYRVLRKVRPNSHMKHQF